MKHFKNVLVAILDGFADDSGDFMDQATQVSFMTPYAEIVLDCNKSSWPIGKATNMKVSQHKVYADLEFYDQPSHDLLSRVPAFCGTLISRMANHVTAARLDYVGMSKENQDKRIPNLQHYSSVTITLPPLSGNPAFEIHRGPPLKPAAKADCVCESLLHGHSEGCAWMK